MSSLIESDEKLGTEYLKTLKAYFQYHGNINEVSEALYIHPNTLRNRLKKIEDMTGVYLQNNVEFSELNGCCENLLFYVFLTYMFIRASCFAVYSIT